MLAPPPVDTNVTRSSRPNFLSAATESPPPTTETARLLRDIASATTRVPVSNGFISNTPIGPFQKIVFARPISCLNDSSDAGPMSRPIIETGISLLADDLGLGVLGEGVCHHEVHGQDDLDAFVGGLGQHLLGGFDPVALDDGLAHLGALRDEERERHAAADQQDVDDVDETVDDAELVAHLAAAEYRYEWPRGLRQHVRERLDLACEQQAGVRRKVVGHAFGGGVSTMSRTERIVDEDVGERRELLGELGVVRLLAWVEPQVLEHEHLAVDQPLDGLGRLLSHRLGGEEDVAPQQTLQGASHRLEGVLQIRLPFRPARDGLR